MQAAPLEAAAAGVPAGLLVGAIDGPFAGDKIVSLSELAAIPGLPSEPTLRKLIGEHADFPLVSRGTNGSAYEIPLAAAIRWFRERREAEEAKARARHEEIRQLGLELLGESLLGDQPAGPVLSASEQRAAMEAELVAIRLGKERGELVVKKDLEAKAGQLAVATRAAFLEITDKFLKRCDLTREEIVELRRVCALQLDGLADKWAGLL